jgi:hypothetical protein
MCGLLHAGFYLVVWIVTFVVGAIQALAGIWQHSDPWFVMLLFAIGGISVFQLLYIIPMVRYLRKRGAAALAKGLVIGAAITFLLNGSCWGWFLITRPRIGG